MWEGRAWEKSCRKEGVRGSECTYNGTGGCIVGCEEGRVCERIDAEAMRLCGREHVCDATCGSHVCIAILFSPSPLFSLSPSASWMSVMVLGAVPCHRKSSLMQYLLTLLA